MNVTESGQFCHKPVIEITDLSFAYESKLVLDQVNICVQERDFVGLIGTNGAGKTTLLRMIVGLLQPDQGSIKLFGEPLAKFKQWNKIGYVSQKNSFNPLFPATVREVVQSGLYDRPKLFRRLTAEDKQKCDEALAALDIEDLAHRRIGELSGGQQQRAFLARALINNPALLILDEPMVGIDAQTQQSFFHMIKHMHQHHNITFLLVSHDLEMVRSYLGEHPRQQIGKLNLFVKHSHDLEDCRETNLTHSLQQLHRSMEEKVKVASWTSY